MTRPDIKRILIPLVSQRAPLGMLEHAAEMAAKLRTELFGLFIEDSDLLNFARLPVGREFCFNTGRIQHSSMDSMERSLRQLANRSQQELSQLATRYKVHSQFITRRGDTQQTVQMEVQPDDLLILSAQGQQANKHLLQQAYDFLHSGHHYLAWLPPLSITNDTINVVQDNSPAAQHCTELAQELASDQGHQISSIPFSTIDNLSMLLKNNRQGLWIVPFGKDWDQRVLDKILASSRCSVLIVNT